ncbi:MAG: Hsp33 family molecular chaperone HslO [Verrucomicrobiota bacterium]
MINFAGRDPFSIVEQYYRQSEQRVARFFEHSPEDYVFISAQPQCDLEWLESLDTDNVRNLDQNEEMSLLETRMFGYDCGCTIDKIIPALSRLSPDEMEDLFQNDQAIAADCPRCAARFHITRESIQDWMDRQGRKS